jgi:GNAT superfamily N-acetyltransferase
MLDLREAASRRDMSLLFSLPRGIYRGFPAHRSTEDDVLSLLLRKGGAFSKKARVKPMLAFHGARPVGRFVLFQDSLKPELAQIGFFEAYGDYPESAELAYRAALDFAPTATTVVAGLGGHMNYSAGFLLDRFDAPPAFGLPHTAPWYPGWFSGWRAHKMFSYRFPTAPFHERLGQLRPKRDSGIRVRPLDMRNLSRDVRVYSELNNACFAEHPFWIDRLPGEDLDLFLPFRHFLRPEHLLFAEKAGEAIGFFLWYPDFNQLVAPDEGLGPKQLIRHRLGRGIDCFRFTQIAIRPEYRASDASLRLIAHAAPFIKKRGYAWGEGGFIFESNSGSMGLAERFFKRVLGAPEEPYRGYALYERGRHA